MEKNKNLCFHEAKFIDQHGNLQTSKIPVVQELARQAFDDIPQRFKQLNPNDEQTPSRHHNFSELPLPSVNLAKLVGGAGAGSGSEARADELEKLAKGVKKWGMFTVEDHGIDRCVMEGVKEVVKGFFEMPFEEKKRSVGCYMNVDNMGYGRNFVKSEYQPLDWIDRLTMIAAPQTASQGLNVWPNYPPNFREVVERYVKQARKTLDKLLEALAESLSLEPQAFLKSFDPKESQINVRINYYPPCPRPDLALGLTPHSDASALTLLMQFGASRGLQLLDKDQKWFMVPWPTEALLVNVGDLLEIMSNGRVKSPWHRVVTDKYTERFSVALFYNPPSEAEIEPVKDEEGGGGYKRVVVGSYCKHFYEVSPATSKEATIMFAKVA